MVQCCPDQGLQGNLGVWITCGSVSGWLLGLRGCVMGVDSPVGGRGGSGGGLVLFELLEGHITKTFVVEFWGLPPLILLLQYVNRLGFEICSVWVILCCTGHMSFHVKQTSRIPLILIIRCIRVSGLSFIH